MSIIRRYVLVDSQNIEGDYEYTTLREAIKNAGSFNAVIEREYEYSDSSLVWTPDGGNTWPPEETESDVE